MKTLDYNYTQHTLKSLIGKKEIIRKFIADPNRVGLLTELDTQKQLLQNTTTFMIFKDNGDFPSRWPSKSITSS